MKTKISIFFILIVALFASITLFQYYNEDTSSLELAREAASSDFVESDTGVTRYDVFGEENAPAVILIHSFNGFLESWSPNINALVDAGYRVVAYDLYGRGLSDRPYTEYDLPFFRSQLDSVIKEVGVKNAHLVGSSFGCVIASDYAIHHPERVDGLVMVGPAGWPPDEGRNPLLDVPILGDLVFHYFGDRILRPKVEAYFLNPAKYPDLIDEWSRFAGYAGFTRSALSTLRHSPVLDYMAGWEKLGALNKPTVFIWGKQDVSFPFHNTKQLPTLIPHARVVGIDGAAHWVNIEQAEMVNKEIIEFLGASDGA